MQKGLAQAGSLCLKFLFFNFWEFGLSFGMTVKAELQA